jgi:hypothetical protein
MVVHSDVIYMTWADFPEAVMTELNKFVVFHPEGKQMK